MDMPIFSLLQSFQHDSLLTLNGCCTGMCFGKLHLEHLGEDLGFLGSPEALPQLRGLLVILIIQSKQVRGHVHYGSTLFLRIPPLQSLHASPPCPSILFQRWKEPHGGMSNELFIDLEKVPQGFAGHNLVGVDEPNPGCGHILGLSDVGELLTLLNVDGNLTPLSAMLFILTALILGAIIDFELLQGGMQDSGKTLNVQAVGTNPGSYQLWRWLQGRLSKKLAQRKS